MSVPLSVSLSGSISGRVTLKGGNPPLFPADIYLDDKVVGTSNVNGEYLIVGVRLGKHKVGAKVNLYPGNWVETLEMIPGENLRNVNIEIGK